jgi:hypothetical protein
MNWLRRLFGRESRPPSPPPTAPADRIDPFPAETAVQWSAEDQAVPEGEARDEWMEKGEPEPRRQDSPPT